jgi:hypothetical protein
LKLNLNYNLNHLIMAKKTKEEVQRDLQGFMRTLLGDSQIATLFLKAPQDVAKRFGIIISAKDATSIKESLETIVTGKIPVAEDCSWHDFPECDHIAHSINPQEDVIHPNLEKVRKYSGRKVIAEDCSWHDFPECDHIAHSLNPVEKVSNPATRRGK